MGINAQKLGVGAFRFFFKRHHGIHEKVIIIYDKRQVRAVLMGTKSCTKILNFSTRFSCENLAVEDFVTLLMGKKSC